MARRQAQGGSRGKKGPSEKPKGKVGSDSKAAKSVGGRGCQRSKNAAKVHSGLGQLQALKLGRWCIRRTELDE